uniref:Uncharacterized protein n=1 Tax=Mycena chlorophos TaxID=658473 RepID=A0ABQ0LQW7_MYCCL|nr:predicted protein [Mycena chlorophos]
MSAPTSTTSLVSSSPTMNSAAQEKDFQAAFASLQSMYGFNGTAPAPTPIYYIHRKTAAKTAFHDASSASENAPIASSENTTGKNYEAAFANLQSTYGFGGAAPMPVPPSKRVKRARIQNDAVNKSGPKRFSLARLLAFLSCRNLK